MRDGLIELVQATYRALRPRAPVPELTVKFHPFANINNTIRLREGKLFIRLSDVLEGAPESIHQAILHILLAKMYRKPIEREQSSRYHRYISSQAITQKAHQLRQLRGRKHISSPRGRAYDLELIFDELNTRFFYGLMARPQLTWSQTHSRRSLGHYDPAHNAIVVSRIFDHPGVPRYAVEYILYHEMLHLKHPVKLRGSRRCVHPKEFQAEEKLFPEFDKALKFIKAMPASIPAAS